MSTEFIGKSVTKGRGGAPLYPYQINTASLKTGAAVVFDSSVAGQMVKAPAAAAASGFAGLIFTEYQVGAAGSAVGGDVELQRTGIGMGILDAGNAVTVGQPLVISDVDGSLRPFAVATDDDCDIIGTSEMTLGSQGVNTPIPVNLDAFSHVAKDAS